MDLTLKDYKLRWQKVERVDRVCINDYPKKNLPTHEAILPKQIGEQVKALARATLTNNFFVNNRANQNLNTSQKVYS